MDETSLDIGGVANTNFQVADLTLPTNGDYRIEIRSAYSGKTFGAYTLVIGPEVTNTVTPTATPEPTFRPPITPESTP